MATLYCLSNGENKTTSMDKTPYANLDKAHFVVGLLPAVVRVSEETGFSSDLMLAQAIQETGWGKSMQQGEAAGTFNLFGIKADKSWTGPTKDFVTHEFINGERIVVTDKFRVYLSYDEALRDRAKFLEENPRYKKLLEEGTKGDYFKESRELQKAGYATDPNYTDNLTALFRGKTLQEAQKIITDNNFVAGFGQFTDPNSPFKSPADFNNNFIPDIIESQLKKQHSSQMENAQSIVKVNSDELQVKPTQDQIVAALILQNIQTALKQGGPLPLIYASAQQPEIS
ncbi:MAG: glycoside hydrolase family 73 protein [Methylotenera sp.]